MEIENDEKAKGNNNVEEFPGTRARMVLGEIGELLIRAREIIWVGRSNLNKALADNALGQANAQELQAKYDAMENLCSMAENVARALREKIENGLLLEDAETAKGQLAAAVVQAGG